jgi:hypothetical protein
MRGRSVEAGGDELEERLVQAFVLEAIEDFLEETEDE